MFVVVVVVVLFFLGGRCSFFSGLGVSESKVQGLFVFVVVTVGREEEESML